MKISEDVINRVNNIYWGYDTKKQVIKKPKDLAVLTSYSSFGKNNTNGPIGVANALFNKEEVTVIMLGGTQIREGQATSYNECKLCFYEKDNDYIKDVKDVIMTLDKKKPLIISGVSLGGMIAQQILSLKDITDNFNIKSIICFGSPIVFPLYHKDYRVIRFVEKGDAVPKFGNINPKKFRYRKLYKELENKEKIMFDGKYKTKVECHALSYVELKEFDKYDFYGVLNGNNTLELLEDIRYFDAPVIKC